MAGNADYKGRLNAVGSSLLNEIKGTDRYTKYREMDEVFPDQVTLDNADEVLMALAPRSKVTFNSDGTVSGGDAQLDKQGRVNLDKIPRNLDELSKVVPDEVDSSLDPKMRAFIYPDEVNSPSLYRAAEMGKAMRANDTARYREVGMPIQVDDDAAAYIGDRLSQGRNDIPIRSGSFVSSGGLGSESRGHILIPGTDKVYREQDKATQAAYKDVRRNNLVKQWLSQGGASIGNPSTAIVPPGMDSHMDHIQPLSRSIDSQYPESNYYSDGIENLSYLDAPSNVHSKLNYYIGGQHNLIRLADEMRAAGQPFPARLSQQKLGDPNRVRLSDEEGAFRLATDKINNLPDKAKNIIRVMRLLEYGN